MRNHTFEYAEISKFQAKSSNKHPMNNVTTGLKIKYMILGN